MLDFPCTITFTTFSLSLFYFVCVRVFWRWRVSDRTKGSFCLFFVLIFVSFLPCRFFFSLFSCYLLLFRASDWLGAPFLGCDVITTSHGVTLSLFSILLFYRVNRGACGPCLIVFIYLLGL